MWMDREMLSSADVTAAGCLRQYAKMMDLGRSGALSSQAAAAVAVH
jgi:hypothetical protein